MYLKDGTRTMHLQLLVVVREVFNEVFDHSLRPDRLSVRVLHCSRVYPNRDVENETYGYVIMVLQIWRL